MSTIQSLLAATDFSDHGRHAVRRAGLLAAAHQARLTLMHVMNGPSLEALRSVFRVPEGAEARLVAEARQALDELAAALAGEVRPAPVTQVRIGRVLDELLAASGQADLLVLGARGWNPVRDVLLGSTADRLLRKCRRPVLVVKRAPRERYRRVLVPVDFSPCSAAALQLALHIAPGAEITVVHAFEVPFEGKLWLADVAEEKIGEYRSQARQQALDQIDLLLRETGADPSRTRRVVAQGDAAPLILAEETGRDADLIVIGKHGRSLIEETLLGSVTRHVLADANCDVLVVHEQAAAAGV